MRIQFEIKEGLINILDQLMHSDFWATEIKEDESGKKIIKIKDLAYNLEAVAEVMGNEIFIRTALSKYTYRIYEVKGECKTVFCQRSFSGTGNLGYRTSVQDRFFQKGIHDRVFPSS